MITNAIAIKFCNEQIRPMAERLRALQAMLNSMETDWAAGLPVLFPNQTSEKVDDGRSAEGIATLNGADVHEMMAVVAAVNAAITGTVVAKPCVRPLQAG